jgi:hypothetical protein
MEALDERTAVRPDRILELVRREPHLEIDQVAREWRDAQMEVRGAEHVVGSELTTQDVQRLLE